MSKAPSTTKPNEPKVLGRSWATGRLILAPAPKRRSITVREAQKVARQIAAEKA